MVLDTTRHVVLDDDLVTAGRNAGYVITFYFVALYFDSKGHALFAHCHWMDRGNMIWQEMIMYPCTWYRLAVVCVLEMMQLCCYCVWLPSQSGAYMHSRCAPMSIHPSTVLYV